MPTLQVFFRVVYGNQLIYPACVVARKLVEFAGVKTFNSSQLARLKEAGFYVEAVRDPRAIIPAGFDAEAEAFIATELRRHVGATGAA